MKNLPPLQSAFNYAITVRNIEVRYLFLLRSVQHESHTYTGIGSAPVSYTHLDVYKRQLLYDPQTSGGLLISVPEKSAPPLLRALRDHLPCAEEIGHVEPKQGDTFLWVR